MPDDLSHSARFLRPFTRIAGGDACLVSELVRGPRLPVGAAEALVAGLVERTGDQDIGLKAGRAVPLGLGGLLDYAMRSAPTLRAATQLAQQHARLFSDTLDLRIEVQNEHALIRLNVSGTAGRVIGDFAMAAWYMNHVQVPLADAPDLACWFERAQPQDIGEYAKTFGRAALRFGAPCNGFTFERWHLDEPLESANPVLHAFLCSQLAVGVNDLPDAAEAPQQLRRLIAQQLPTGALTLHSVAHAIRVSPRTLARRLEAAGTTFSAELDQLRHKLALQYVASSSIPLAQVPLLLGFAHVTSFYRNFKRWTNQTPLEYRRKHGL